MKAARQLLRDFSSGVIATAWNQYNFADRSQSTTSIQQFLSFKVLNSTFEKALSVLI